MSIAGGRFTDSMGNTHDIAAFELGKTEVTVSQYEGCVKAGKCDASGVKEGGVCNYGVSGKGDHPVNCVTWQEAAVYCEWDGGRLPTEWEWAARGGEVERSYAWGNVAPSASRACGNRWESKEGTCEVTAHPQGASRDGVLGRSGNVWEWTGSWYVPGTFVVLRGGSWNDGSAGDLRADIRINFDPSYRFDIYGFRCARTG